MRSSKPLVLRLGSGLPSLGFERESRADGWETEDGKICKVCLRQLRGSYQPAILLLTGGFPAAAGKPGSSGSPGEGRTAQQDVCCPQPRGRSARCCRASAMPRKGRAALQGSCVPLLNPSCNFKSTANKAQLP